jgi:hypothetical protein
MAQLVVDRTDIIDGAVAHTVHTTARIGGGAPGLMVATSTFRSANWLSGFKAAAVVVLVDEGGNILARSDPPQHGWADGTWIGVHETTTTWTYQFDPNVANSAANIGVLHFPDENYLSNLNGLLGRLGSIWNIIATFLQNNPSGGNTYDQTTESGGGGGSLGQTDDQQWALMADPWKSYATPPVTHTGQATANPNAFLNHVLASITVHATDAATNTPIQGIVYIGATAAGHTDQPFTHTWNQRGFTRIDPSTHRPSIVPAPLEPMTVRVNGYNPITVTYTVSDGLAPPRP